MNFKESIKPLTQLLSSNGFSIQLNENYLIEFASKSMTIRIGYSILEYSFIIWVGQNRDKLIELRPNVVEELFNDNSYKFQATLTIENFINFLGGTGKNLLVGNTKTLEELNQYSLQSSFKNTRQIINQQIIKEADKAWTQKDYVNFIKHIDKIQTELLPPPYLKKYKMAVEKMKK